MMQATSSPDRTGARDVPAVRGLPVRGGIGAAYVLSMAATLLLALISAAGLLYGRRGLYQDDPVLLPQFLGQDAVMLFGVVPLFVGAMWFARRGSARALVLWTAALFDTSYFTYFYIGGVRFGPLFLVYIATVSCSVFALLVLFVQADVAAFALRVSDRAQRPRTVGGFLVATAVLFVLLWVSDVIRRLRTGVPIDPVSHAVYAIDLTVVLPAAIATGAALWRRAAWAYLPAGMLVIKIAVMMLTLLVTAAWSAAAGQAVPIGLVAAYGGSLVAVGWCAVLHLRAIE